MVLNFGQPSLVMKIGPNLIISGNVAYLQEDKWMLGGIARTDKKTEITSRALSSLNLYEHSFDIVAVF